VDLFDPDLFDDAQSDKAKPDSWVKPPPFACELTGEIIDYDNIDGLAYSLESHLKLKEKLDTVIFTLKRYLADHDSSEKVTSRIQGSIYEVTLTKPSVKFNSSALKQMVKDFPSIAPSYIVPNGYKVVMKEYNKIEGTEFTEQEKMKFKDRLLAACEGRAGTPQIKLKRLNNESDDTE